MSNTCSQKTSNPSIWFYSFTGTKWYLGHGHSIFEILKYLKTESNPDPRTLLDGLFFDVDGDEHEMPVVIMEATSHSMWVNSVALRFDFSFLKLLCNTILNTSNSKYSSTRI